MKEYVKKPAPTSRRIDSHPRTSRQASISDILQACKPVSWNHMHTLFVSQFCRHDPTCPYSALYPCPVHEYSQASDPSRIPYLQSGASYIGEKAMRKEDRGVTPTTSEVRVHAKNTPFSRAGVGLDEWLPTDQRALVASSKIPGLPGIQSGARVPTDHAILQAPGGMLGGHTGMFPKSSGRGSTHTTSQSHAHDLRRSTLPSSSSREEAVVKTIAAGLSSMAHGEQIIHSPELTGATPNYKGAAPIGSSASDPTRVALASIQHESREHVKKRLVTYADLHHLPRSVSPEREPIKADGTGGGYSTGPIRVPSPVPFMVGTTDSEKSAGESAWITAPFFPTSFASSKTKVCPNCRILNESNAINCAYCFHKL